MGRNIIIRGRAGVGKTTLVKRVSERLDMNVGGFYTEEIRERGCRVGFRIKTFDGREGMLAHVGLFSRFRVGRYFVNIHDLDDIAVGAITSSMGMRVVVVDEIGEMELFSGKFRHAVLNALDRGGVIATMKALGDGFTKEITQRGDTLIIEVDPGNRDELVDEVLRVLST